MKHGCPNSSTAVMIGRRARECGLRGWSNRTSSSTIAGEVSSYDLNWAFSESIHLGSQARGDTLIGLQRGPKPRGTSVSTVWPHSHGEPSEQQKLLETMSGGVAIRLDDVILTASIRRSPLRDISVSGLLPASGTSERGAGRRLDDMEHGGSLSDRHHCPAGLNRLGTPGFTVMS